MEIQIELQGLDLLIAKLGRLAAFRSLQPAMRDSLNRVWGDVAKYPKSPPEGVFKGFVSAKQRRWFFAALREGRIEVPYKRTGTLGRSWTMKVDTNIDGIEGWIGTNTIYAPWVQDRNWQAAIHQGRWQTAQDVFEKQRAWIVQRFNRAIAQLLR